MVVDRLYDVMRHAKYPIRNRRELISALGDIMFFFEGRMINTQEIALNINKYPIRDINEFFHLFFKKESKNVDLDESGILDSLGFASEFN